MPRLTHFLSMSAMLQDNVVGHTCMLMNHVTSHDDLEKWGMVTNLIQPTSRPTDGRLSVDCRSTVGRVSADVLGAVFQVNNRLRWRCVGGASVTFSPLLMAWEYEFSPIFMLSSIISINYRVTFQYKQYKRHLTSTFFAAILFRIFSAQTHSFITQPGQTGH